MSPKGINGRRMKTKTRGWDQRFGILLAAALLMGVLGGCNAARPSSPVAATGDETMTAAASTSLSTADVTTFSTEPEASADPETSAAASTVSTAATAAPPAATTTAATPPPTGADPRRDDIVVRDGLTYVQGILIANKTYALPKTYAPGEDKTARAAFERMKEAAAAEGLTLKIVSGYRSYKTQNTLYTTYVKRSGQKKADTFSARPGHSEHQTGLAFDINKASDSFANTPEAKWLAEHCHEFGFILRYPRGKEAITGYKYEPWHVRYLGKERAAAVTASGLCLEEYLHISSCYAD